MTNKFCGMIAKELIKLKNCGFISYYYKVPEIRQARPVFGDFLVILPNTYIFYIEAKSTHSTGFANVYPSSAKDTVQISQNAFNKLHNAKTGLHSHSSHFYLFGDLRVPMKSVVRGDFQGRSRYFVVEDIMALKAQIKTKQPYIGDLLTKADMVSNNLGKLLSGYFKLGFDKRPACLVL